jgi:hypothetical protein
VSPARTASPPTSAAAAPTSADAASAASGPDSTAAAAAGTVLAQVNGLVTAESVISNPQGVGFVIPTEDGLQSYDDAGHLLTTIPASSYAVDCGAADVSTPTSTVLLTENFQQTPAEGIQPATSGVTLTAWDATSGARQWTDTVIAASTSAPDACDSENQDSDLQGVSVTRDGQWAAFSWYGASDAVDVSSGKIYPNKSLAGVLGNWAVTGTGQNNAQDGPSTYILSVPGSWSGLGTSSNPDIQIVDSGDQAPTGLVNANDSDGSSMATTPDGNELIVEPNSSEGAAVEAFALPSLRPLWTSATQATSIQAVSAGAAVVTVEGDGYDYLVALNPRTGKSIWSVKFNTAVDGSAGALCDLTSTQVLMATNGQLATLDAATGKQISYRSDPYQTDSDPHPACPEMVGTGLTGVGLGTAEADVEQILTP